MLSRIFLLFFLILPYLLRGEAASEVDNKEKCINESKEIVNMIDCRDFNRLNRYFKDCKNHDKEYIKDIVGRYFVLKNKYGELDYREVEYSETIFRTPSVNNLSGEDEVLMNLNIKFSKSNEYRLTFGFIKKNNVFDIYSISIIEYGGIERMILEMNKKSIK